MTFRNLAKVHSAELDGIDAKLIEVEIDLNVGLHAFNIVGLADRALNEARERVNSALKNSGIKPPNRENRKITVNLAPADFKKTGSHYDLAIALGYLLATGQMVPFDSRGKLFVGELALDGRLRPVNGALSIAQLAGRCGFTQVFLPRENAVEAAAISGVVIIPLRSLNDAIAYLEGRTGIEPIESPPSNPTPEDEPDLSEIVGQANAKRALLIAASGGHNLLMSGPPGVGKSMLAKALAGILPALTREESIEITKIWSANGLSAGKIISRRPFRAPHQTASTIALIGGGNPPRPGEASLAHRGVLFLDELPEFPRAALESLRAPLESGTIRIARVNHGVVFPARFSLAAAMNPCPCGYYGDTERECRCSAYEVLKYQKRISGPLLDRIDLQIKLGRVKITDLRSAGERTARNGASLSSVSSSWLASSATAKEKVAQARATQTSRFRGSNIMVNAEMSTRDVRRVVKLEPGAEHFLETLDRSRLTPRGYYRVLKVAQTVADLEGRERISSEHIAEAFSYRVREGT